MPANIAEGTWGSCSTTPIPDKGSLKAHHMELRSINGYEPCIYAWAVNKRQPASLRDNMGLLVDECVHLIEVGGSLLTDARTKLGVFNPTAIGGVEHTCISKEEPHRMNTVCMALLRKSSRLWFQDL